MKRALALLLGGLALPVAALPKPGASPLPAEEPAPLSQGTSETPRPLGDDDTYPVREEKKERRETGERNKVKSGAKPAGRSSKTTVCTMTVCTMTIAPWLPKESIKRTISAAMPLFRTCYVEARTRQPSLTGRVTLQLAIDEGSGLVLSSSASGDELPETLRNCVATAGQSLAFLPLEGRDGLIEITYPFVFIPAE